VGLYSNQVVFCNACGCRMHVPPASLIGRDYRVCSRQCLAVIRWREVCSLMNKEWRPCKSFKRDEIDGHCSTCGEPQVVHDYALEEQKEGE
jgi:hypothetical protein